MSCPADFTSSSSLRRVLKSQEESFWRDPFPRRLAADAGRSLRLPLGRPPAAGTRTQGKSIPRESGCAEGLRLPSQAVEAPARGNRGPGVVARTLSVWLEKCHGWRGSGRGFRAGRGPRRAASPRRCRVHAIHSSERPVPTPAPFGPTSGPRTSQPANGSRFTSNRLCPVSLVRESFPGAGVLRAGWASPALPAGRPVEA